MNSLFKLCDYGCGQQAKYKFKNEKVCCEDSQNKCPTIRERQSRSKKGKKYLRIFNPKKLSENINILCDYGCGKKAKYKFKNGKVCCEDSKNKCLTSRENISKCLKNRIFSEEHKENLSISKLGSVPWNKGKKDLQNAWNKGKSLPTLTQEHKEKISNSTTLEKNGNWKGGYSKNNISSYDYFYNKLTIEEDPQRDLDDPGALTVLCTKCKKRFIPTFTAAYERYRSLSSLNYGENRLYCSDKCKQKCSIFNKRKYQEGHPKNELLLYTQEEYNLWKQTVLKQDNYECQKCGSKKNLHCHHIIPVKENEILALDLDNGIVLCHKCHYEIGHKTGTECSTGNLANRVCN